MKAKDYPQLTEKDAEQILQEVLRQCRYPPSSLKKAVKRLENRQNHKKEV